MADIKLTAGPDAYTQKLADKDVWNNYYGLEGNDSFLLYQGTVLGGAGDDRIELIPTAEWWRNVQAAYWDSPAGVKVDLAAGTAEDGWGGHDTLVGVKDLSGSSHGDVLSGDARDNRVWPNGGNDVVDGRGGTDTVALPSFQPSPGATWRPVRIEELSIQVSPDGTLATVAPLSGTGFAYTLTNVEKVQVFAGKDAAGSDIYLIYELADFIQPQDMAQQAIAAGPSLRWNASAALGSPVALTFSFVTQAPGSGVGAAGFRAFTPAEQQAVRDMLNHTAALTGLSFTEVSDAGTSGGQLRFGVSQQAATKGVAWMPGQAGAADQAGDVWMDVDSMHQLTPGSEGYQALLHEIGHALGLRHPRNLDAGDTWSLQLRPQDDNTALTVMSEGASADGLFRSEWGALDVLALRYLYGTRSVNTGDDVHTLGLREANAQTTLTDDGGVDTLDASGLTAGVSLDLVPGHLSSAGLSSAGVAAVNNLALPAGTWIENAVGTAFDDVIVGNRLDNRLTGGDGNDWVDGGAGNDLALFGGLRADYEVSTGFGKVYVKARNGVSGFDTLADIERLQFADQIVSLSTSTLAADATYTLDEDTVLRTSLPAPTDVAAGSARYSLVTGSSHGNSSITAQGQLSYTPEANYFGGDSVTFDVTGPSGSNRYVAHLSVQPINDGPPVAANAEYLLIAGTTLQSTLPVATDVDGDAIAYSLVSDPLHGSINVSSDGRFSYKPSVGYVGSDTATFQVSDGMGGSNRYSLDFSAVAVSHVVTGTDGVDDLAAAASADGYALLGGDDRVTGGSGNDLIDGGPGRDTAVYATSRSACTVAAISGGWQVTDKFGASGTDRLTSVERLHFSDREVALDMGANEHGGQAAQVLRALFGTATLKVAEYAGYGVVLLDQGMSYAALVDMAVHTDAFWSLAGDPAGHSNTAFVKAVYKNVTGVDASAAELQNYVGLLNNGSFTQSSLALLACQIDLNVHSPDLVGVASTGLDYIVPPGLG